MNYEVLTNLRHAQLIRKKPRGVIAMVSRDHAELMYKLCNRLNEETITEFHAREEIHKKGITRL